MTQAERALWRALRAAFPAEHWRRQVPLGSYIVDFCSHRCRLIIEVDGGQHSDIRDARRTRFLESQGYRLLRFWNHEVLGNIDGVVARIAAPASEPRP